MFDFKQMAKALEDKVKKKFNDEVDKFASNNLVQMTGVDVSGLKIDTKTSSNTSSNEDPSTVAHKQTAATAEEQSKQNAQSVADKSNPVAPAPLVLAPHQSRFNLQGVEGIQGLANFTRRK